MTSITHTRITPLKNILMVHRLVRLPNLLIIVAAQYLCRVFVVGPTHQWKQLLIEPGFFLLSLSTVCIAAAGYIINDYYDVKIDLINKPERVVVGRSMGRRVAMAAHTFLSLAGIGIGMLLSWKIALINLLSVFLLWLYSNQLKRMPFIGNLVIAALTAASIMIVAIYYDLENYLVHMFALFAFYISLIREIIKDMEDLRGDMHFGCRTLPIIWGIRKTKTIIYSILLLFVLSIMLLLLLLQHRALTIYFFTMGMPTLYFIYKLYWADTRRAYHHLSIFCKMVMLSGLTMMMLI